MHVHSGNTQPHLLKKHVYIQVYEYIYTDTHIFIYIQMHMHTYTHTYTHIYICMYMHIYTQIENLSNDTSTPQAI